MKFLTYIVAMLLLTATALAWCGEGNVNSFVNNDSLYLYGYNFEPNCDFNWFAIGNNGSIFKMIGLVQTSSKGMFSVYVSNDTVNNYTFKQFEYGHGIVDSSNEPIEKNVAIPEFTTIGYAFAIMGASTVIFYMRKKDLPKGRRK